MVETANKAVVLHMRCEDIVIGDRRREEYGAVDELAASIERYGLLHPIVIDSDDKTQRNLIAGGRRLEAVKRLGWERVPVRLLGTLTAAERREIELEENLQRLDLSTGELDKSMTVIQLAETAAEVLRDQEPSRAETFRTDAKDDAGRFVGKPDSTRRVAERIGVDEKTIRNARQHIAAVEAHPELKDEPQSTAIDYAKAVKKEPTLIGSPVAQTVETYREARARTRTPGVPAPKQSEIRGVPTQPADEPEGERTYRLLIAAMLHVMDGAPPKGMPYGPRPDDIASLMPSRKRGQDLLGTVRDLENWCAEIRGVLGHEIGRPLRAVQ